MISPTWFIWVFWVSSAIFLTAASLNHLLNQGHHFYWGLWLVAGGFTLGLASPMYLGIVFMADDALQHAVQLFYPKFLSPVHLIYRYTLYPVIRI